MLPDSVNDINGQMTYSGSSIVQDSGQDEITKLANDLNLRLDDSTKDLLIQYYLQEKGSENAMGRSREFNQNQYSDMIAGLRKAGLNPFLAVQGLQGANMMQGQSSQIGTNTQQKIASQNRGASTAASVIGSILMAIAIVVAAAL